MILRRRLFPPAQTARCSACGLVITERRRRPCPVCCSLARSLDRTADERLGTADRPT